jgi:hypothetical protein
MFFLSILASPPPAFSPQAHAKVLSRFVKAAAIAGLIASGFSLTTPHDGKSSRAVQSARQASDGGESERGGRDRANEAPRWLPPREPRDARPVTRLAQSFTLSSSKWSGAL